MSKRFKIVIVGDGATGKSSFIKRHVTRQFQVEAAAGVEAKAEYIPTIGVDVHPLAFDTNYGSIILDCWDTAGKDEFSGLSDGYYVGAKGCIVFFDVCRKDSYLNAMTWHQAVCDVAGDVPTILCGNKVDSPLRVVHPGDITYHPENVLMYYDVSVNANHNLRKPFLELLRCLMEREDLEWI